MGLDLYSGALSKLYAREYETPQARFSRENGLQHQTLFTDGRSGENREEIANAIINFQENLSEYFAENNADFKPWNENENNYLTEQLHLECFKALQVICLEAARGEKYSGAFDDDENIVSFLQMRSREEYFESGHAVLECQLFVPANHNECVPVNDGVTGRVIMTTTSNLKRVLSQLKESAWSDETKPEFWFNRGPVVQGKIRQLKRGILPWKKNYIEVEATLPENPLRHNAEYAYGVFWKLLSFAEKHNLPMKQDS